MVRILADYKTHDYTMVKPWTAGDDDPPSPPPAKRPDERRGKHASHQDCARVIVALKPCEGGTGSGVIKMRRGRVKTTGPSSRLAYVCTRGILFIGVCTT